MALHVIERAGQRTGVRAAIAAARIDQCTEPGDGRQFFRKIAPHGDTAQTFVEEDEGWRIIRPGAVPDGFEPLVAKIEIFACCRHARSLKR